MYKRYYQMLKLGCVIAMAISFRGYQASILIVEAKELFRSITEDSWATPSKDTLADT